MVYRGKPSTGCKNCRQRKIKCDERSGGCLRCANKKLVCPGYDHSPDPFRDESAAVQVKAEKAKAKALIARDEREKVAHAKAVLEKLNNAIGMPILAPMIDQAIFFFMNNYSWGLDSPPIQSKYYNQHLSTHGFHPIIATCMTALGLAGVANICKDTRLKRESTKWYTDALQMANKAITDPTQVTSDNTLLATVLLSVFEATHNDKSLNGWSHHISGSASLLRLRGKQQFSTPAGRRMWLQITSLLTLQCMGMGEGLPRFVHELNHEVDRWEDKKDPGMRFYHLHIATIELRAQILKGRLTDLRAIVERATELDEAAKSIIKDMDSGWAYQVEHCDYGIPGVFGNYYHIYPHLAAAQTWNWIRYNRIYLHDFIRNSLIAGFSTSPPVFAGMEHIRLLETSTEALYRVQADIIASIPQYLHDTPNTPTQYSSDGPSISVTLTGTPPPDIPTRSRGKSDPSSTSSPPSFSCLAMIPSPVSTQSSTSASPTATTTHKLFTTNFRADDPQYATDWRSSAEPKDQLPIVRVSGGYSSLWALYIAGATPIASPESQEYVMSTLKRTSNEFGINQAKILAGALKMKIDMDKVEAMEKGTRGGVESGRVTGIVPIYLPLVGPHLSSDGED